jgi:hypothetical protein
VPTAVGIKPKWTSDRHESVDSGQRKKTMIEEHDRVVLTDPLPERALQAGDVGTVVHVYEKGTAYEAECFRLDGRTGAVEALSASAVRPVASTDVPHARTRE